MDNLTYGDSFWNNTSKANNIIKKINHLKKNIEFYTAIEDQHEFLLMHVNENNNQLINQNDTENKNIIIRD